jgi:hypothetical protein
MADPSPAGQACASGEQVPGEVFVLSPAASGYHHGVVSDSGPVARCLDDGGPAPDSAERVEQPDPGVGRIEIGRPGELPSEGEGPSQISCGHLVAGDVDHLERLNVSAATQLSCKVQ